MPSDEISASSSSSMEPEPPKLESASSVGLKRSSYLGSVGDWVMGISSKDTDETAEFRQPCHPGGLARVQSSLTESNLL